MAAMVGPLCRKWSPGSKPEKQWLQLQIDLYILTDEFKVTIKIFRNNAMHVCCNSESSLAAKTIFSSYSFANHDLGHNWLSSDSCSAGLSYFSIAIAIPCMHPLARIHR